MQPKHTVLVLDTVHGFKHVFLPSIGKPYKLAALSARAETEEEVYVLVTNPDALKGFDRETTRVIITERIPAEAEVHAVYVHYPAASVSDFRVAVGDDKAQ